MSIFGFIGRNDYGGSAISSQARNLIYVGRATQVAVRQYPTATYAEFSARAGLSTPMCFEYVFTFPYAHDDQIVPAATGAGYFTVAYCRKANATTWEVSCFATSPPEIHMFAPIPANAPRPGGWGVAMYDETGRIAFSHDKPHMIPREVLVLETGSSGISATGNSTFSVVYPTQAIWSVDIGAYTKPLVIFGAGEHAVGSSRPDKYVAWFGRAINFSSGRINCRWALTWISGLGDVAANGPAQNLSALIVDLADYT